TLALVVIGIGFFIFSMYFGGSREARNASDASALNVGKQAATINVNLGGGDEGEFTDVADSGQFINLKNINRVWGKALMVGMNASQMGGSANGNASNVRAAAQAISEKLSTALSKADNLTGFYQDLAGANSLRMLGNNSQLKWSDLPDWK